MENIGSWVALIAATSIVSAVFASIIPSGKMKTAFSVLTGIILVCAVVSPLATEKIEFDFESFSLELEEKKSEYKKESEKALSSVAKEGFQNAIAERLKNCGYDIKKVEVKCDGEYRIKSVKVKIDGNFDEESVRKEIESFCESGAEIKIIKGERYEIKDN